MGMLNKAQPENAMMIQQMIIQLLIVGEEGQDHRKTPQINQLKRQNMDILLYAATSYR